MPNPPSTQSVCPHGCVNGVITDSDLGGEGTSSYCPIHGSMAQRVDRMNEAAAAAADHAKRAADKLRASSPDTQTEECYDDSHAGYNSETGACLTCGKLVHGVLYGDELRRAEGMCKAPPPDPQGQVDTSTSFNCEQCHAACISMNGTRDGPLCWTCENDDLRSALDQAKRRAEEAKADASEANHQANMMSRNLQAANALAASYRQGLERLVDALDAESIRLAASEREAKKNVRIAHLAGSARSLLNPSSTSEGDA